MKNHKISAVILALLLTLFAAGCSTTPEISGRPDESPSSKTPAPLSGEYRSLIAAVPNDGTQISSETEFWNRSRYHQKCPEEFTVSFMGKTYTGTYQTSKSSPRYKSSMDKYLCSDMITFTVNHDTGKLRSINFTTSDYFAGEPYLADVEDPEAYAIELAKETAKEFLPDPEQYAVRLNEPFVMETEKEGIGYTVTYYTVDLVKCVAGFDTTDRFSARVASNGTLLLVAVGDTGAYDRIDFTVDEEAFDQSIEAKLVEIFGKTACTYKDHEITSQWLCYAPDGHLGIYSMVAADFAFSNGEECSTAVGIFTYLPTDG